MNAIGLLSLAAGARVLGAAGLMTLALSGAASALPMTSPLPALETLATEGSAEQVQYWRHRHRQCRWVKRCGPYRCHWVRRCW